MIRTRGKILAYAHEVGGARAMLPVLRRLLCDGDCSLVIIASQKAGSVLTVAGLPIILVTELDCSIPVDEVGALRLLERFLPDLLLCSASNSRDPSSGNLVVTARGLGIASVGIVDHWKGSERFRRGANGPLDFLPDKLAVIDEHSHAAYRAQGVPADRLIIVGHSYLEQISKERDAWLVPARVTRLKRQAGLEPDRHVVLFCSELVHDHGYHSSCGEACLPLSHMKVEGQCLRDLLEGCIREFSAYSGWTLELLERMHPNERDEPLWGARRIDQSAMTDTETVAMASVVLGLSSMPLFEAAVLGIPAASLAFFDGWSPSRVYFDERTWAEQRFFRVLYDFWDLRVFLRETLLGRGGNRSGLVPPNAVFDGATDRCAALIKSSLGPVPLAPRISQDPGVY